MFTRVLAAVVCLGLLAALLAGCGGGGSDGPETVTLTIVNRDTGHPVAADWVAFHDGVDGGWTPLTGSGVYSGTLTDPDGAYGFAFVLEQYDYAEVGLLQATTADGKALTCPVTIYQEASAVRRARDRKGRTGGDRIQAGWTQQGTVRNLPAGVETYCEGDRGGWGSGGLYSLNDFAYTFNMPGGVNYDCGMVLGCNDGDSAYPGYLYLRRNLNQPGGTVVNEDIDFSAPYGGVKHTYLCTQGAFAAPEAQNMMVLLHTANGLYLPLVAGYSSGACLYSIPPSSVRLSTDRYIFNAENFTDYTAVSCRKASPSAPSLTLPAPFSFSVVQSNPIVLQGLSHPTADLFTCNLDSASDTTSWAVGVTARWLQTAGAVEYAMPNFSGIPGWQSAWSLSGTPPVSYAYGSAYDYSGSLGQYLLFNTPDGPDMTVRSAYYTAVD